MKRVCGIGCAAALAAVSMGLAAAQPLAAQQTRQQAIAGMRHVLPKEMDAGYTHPAPFAQKLVDQALARHPEVLLLAIHAAPPGQPNLIVASNFGRIGKIGDEDDMRCIHTGTPNLEVNGNHFEAEIVLKDKAGHTLGAIGVVFNYKPGDDKQAFLHKAEQIEAAMQAQLPNQGALFQGS